MSEAQGVVSSLLPVKNTMSTTMDDDEDQHEPEPTSTTHPSSVLVPVTGAHSISLDRQAENLLFPTSINPMLALEQKQQTKTLTPNDIAKAHSQVIENQARAEAHLQRRLAALNSFQQQLEVQKAKMAKQKPSQPQPIPNSTQAFQKTQEKVNENLMNGIQGIYSILGKTGVSNQPTENSSSMPPSLLPTEEKQPVSAPPQGQPPSHISWNVRARSVQDSATK